jgi:hypothetical protein
LNENQILVRAGGSASMLADGKCGAGRPKGSRALTLLAPTVVRMGFYEAARQYGQKARRVIVPF